MERRPCPMVFLALVLGGVPNQIGLGVRLMLRAILYLAIHKLE